MFPVIHSAHSSDGWGSLALKTLEPPAVRVNVHSTMAGPGKPIAEARMTEIQTTAEAHSP
jgi:hypothetical protein